MKYLWLLVFGLLLVGSADAGVGGVYLIGTIYGANMNLTTDQAITLSTTPRYKIDEIDVTNCSASLTLAAGGFYTATSKGGTILVAAAQLYSGATGATSLVVPTLASGALTTTLTANPIYLALTTAQGSAATCDVYIWGKPIF